jgi:prophage antirepressor-like protein
MSETKALTTVFDYQSSQVRVIMRDGEPWFIAKDVCDILDIVSARQAVGKLDEDEKGVCNVYTPGGNQSMLCVSEPGLYGLIFTSRKLEAKAFKRWVKHEVLPSIRKTGSYNQTQTVSSVHALSERFRPRALENLLRVPDGYFSVMGEFFKHLYNVEALLNQSLDEHAMIEISVGQRWSRYARDVLGIPDQERRKYPHLCQDHRTEHVWAYPIRYVDVFGKWLWVVYFPEQFPAYIRYRTRYLQLPAPKGSAQKYLAGSADCLGQTPASQLSMFIEIKEHPLSQ